MNVLIIGGTRFAGRHIAGGLVARGHDVTVFHRGTTPNRTPGTREILGDRAHDLNRIAGRWDAVIDTCGYTSEEVAASAKTFAPSERYVFISSISVYAGDAPANARNDEDAPRAVLSPDADASAVTPETYGALKARCEDVVRDVFGRRATILRPGLIAGPYDPTDRFTYWPLRVDAGGEFLAPEEPALELQYVDARDLADFTATLLETNATGTYNVVTTPHTHTFGELVSACIASGGSRASPTWADAAFLAAHSVAPWTDLPLWIPRNDPSYRLVSASNARGVAAGLRTRPLAQTVTGTLAWARDAGKSYGALAAGLTPDREQELLRILRASAP